MAKNTPKTPKTNTSAPEKTGQTADVSATAAAPAAAQAAPQAPVAPPVVAVEETPPTGGKDKGVATKKPTHLTIHALRPGFRRAGRAWGTEEVTVAVADFSSEQLEALAHEPQLVVVPAAAAK